ncbi:MAG: hypothetical protein GW892_20115 [Armatimonadetes bacterium]|nr:hypothetical protein [Armatimonadota bacterium]NCQ30484.1 hypothetical protein [Armatimonadota bacterium]
MTLLVYLLASPLAYAAAGPVDSLPNPSFERVDEKTGYPQDWESVWGRPTTCAYSLATARTGIACALVTDHSETDSHGLRSKRVAVAPGVTLAASVYVKLADPGGFAVYLEFWNAAGQRVFNRSSGTSAATDWTQLSVTGKAPPDAESATLLIYCGSTSTGVAYFDDASLMAARE